MELSKANPQAAVQYLERAASAEKEPGVPSDFRTRFMLARAYLEARRFDDAVFELEERLQIYTSWRLFHVIWSVKMHFYLGLTHERSGSVIKAIDQYERFLEIWKDADPGIPEIEDARQRLADLKSGA